MFGKLTWRPAPGWQLTHSVHNERWVNGEQPTVARPFETTLRVRGSVPAVTLAHLTHTGSSNTVWDVRVGRFAFSQLDAPSVEHLTLSNRSDQVTKLSSGGPPQVGTLEGTRVTAKATLSRYQAGSRVDHDWKVGGQIEDGAHRSLRVIPTGVRFVDDAGLPWQADFKRTFERRRPSGRCRHVRERHHQLRRAPDIQRGTAVRPQSRDQPGLWLSSTLMDVTPERWSAALACCTPSTRCPRVRAGPSGLEPTVCTLLSGSYGRYNQGVMTGEISPLHPGVTAVVTKDFVPADGSYSRLRSVADASNLEIRSTHAGTKDR